MADAKISALPSATTPLAGTEVLPIVQSGTTTKVSVDNLTTGKTVPVGSLSVTGATPRISADMSNATQANRLMFQTTTANTNTSVGAIPNGTGTSSRVNLFNGSDPDNAGYVQLNSSAAASILNSSKTGAGTTLPIRLQIDGSTQFEVSTAGNLTVSNAAKGVNFTANTPAAGMTSQLLNWYEEGTWAPNQGSGLTVVGAFSSSGTYTRIGRQVFIRGSVSGATSVAVASAGAISTNLPYSAAADATGAAINAANSASSILRVSSATLTAATAIAATATMTFSAVYAV